MTVASPRKQYHLPERTHLLQLPWSCQDHHFHEYATAVLPSSSQLKQPEGRAIGSYLVHMCRRRLHEHTHVVLVVPYRHLQDRSGADDCRSLILVDVNWRGSCDPDHSDENERLLWKQTTDKAVSICQILSHQIAHLWILRDCFSHWECPRCHLVDPDLS